MSDQAESMPERIRRIKARLLANQVWLQAFIQSHHEFDPSFPFVVAKPRFVIVEFLHIQPDVEHPQEGQWVPVIATVRVAMDALIREKDHPELEMFQMVLDCRVGVALLLLYGGGEYKQVEYLSAVVFTS
jgi:hypothetical protein